MGSIKETEDLLELRAEKVLRSMIECGLFEPGNGEVGEE